jgi:hypothetical protein
MAMHVQKIVSTWISEVKNPKGHFEKCFVRHSCKNKRPHSSPRIKPGAGVSFTRLGQELRQLRHDSGKLPTRREIRVVEYHRAISLTSSQS